MRPVRLSPRHPLQEAAKVMVAAAEQGRAVGPILKKHCPNIYRQIAQDGKYPGLLTLWGRSVNVDENVGQTIVHPAILHAIGELAGVPMRGRVVHAGLQHTYGYLFSLIDTPYGAKRDRWVSADLERGFGIELSLLSDRPREGTLLANLTWFIGQIMYRGQLRYLRRLEKNAQPIAPALLDYDYARLSVSRIVEHAVVASQPRRDVSLITDLVPFPHSPKSRDGDNTLLIYSVQYSVPSRIKLITAFPIDSAAAREIKASVPPRRDAEVRVRYNAYVPGFQGRSIRGHCSFAEPPP